VCATDGQSHQLIRDVGRAPRLSATVDGELVAASDCFVTVYSALDGSQLHRLPLDGDARHAVMMTASQTYFFIVCYYPQHEVSYHSLKLATITRENAGMQNDGNCL